jgi:hypothetical protein
MPPPPPMGPPRSNPPGFGPQSMPPLPPLISERPQLGVLRTNRLAATVANAVNDKTDAEIVLSMLGELEEKMQVMGVKVDQFQSEEKKHYENLRRGLKRLKDDKQDGSTGLNEDGDSPCCICNYCLKCTFLSMLFTDVSERGHLRDVR